MTEEPLDSRIEMLVASLYGELSPEEEARFQALRKSDPSLQREWEELTSARTVLSAWDEDESAPSFTFSSPACPKPWESLDSSAVRPTANQAPSTEPAKRGWRRRLRSLLDPSQGLGWAIAAVAILMLVLSYGGFRVEKVDGGFAFRTASSSEPNSEAPSSRLSPTRVPNDMQSVSLSHDSAGTKRVPLTGRFGNTESDRNEPFLSRSEFDAYTAGIAMVMSELINSERQNRVQTQEFNGFVRTLVGDMNDRLDNDYQHLRGGLEAVHHGLKEVEMNTNDRIDLIQVSLTPDPESEGEK